MQRDHDKNTLVQKNKPLFVISLEMLLHNLFQLAIGRRGYLAKGCSIFCHNKAESSLDTIFTEELKLSSLEAVHKIRLQWR